MSNIGISIAGSVAQGSLQAQQVSRALHRHATDSAAQAKRMRERIDAHFAAVDEGDEVDRISQLRIDEQVPERDAHPQQEESASAHHEATDESAADAAEESAADSVELKISDDDQPYHPLDITA